MGKFRKIIVDNSEYMWLFRYDGYDYQNFPYLLITAKAFPKAKYSLQGTTQGNGLTGSILPVRFSM